MPAGKKGGALSLIDVIKNRKGGGEGAGKSMFSLNPAEGVQGNAPQVPSNTSTEMPKRGGIRSAIDQFPLGRLFNGAFDKFSNLPGQMQAPGQMPADGVMAGVNPEDRKMKRGFGADFRKYLL